MLCCDVLCCCAHHPCAPPSPQQPPQLQVLPTALRGAFQSCGQNCAGAERFIVHEKVWVWGGGLLLADCGWRSLQVFGDFVLEGSSKVEVPCTDIPLQPALMPHSTLAQVFDEFVRRAGETAAAMRQGAASGEDPVDLGAMCMPGAAEKVQELVDDAVKKGAKVGEEGGWGGLGRDA